MRSTHKEQAWRARLVSSPDQEFRRLENICRALLLETKIGLPHIGNSSLRLCSPQLGKVMRKPKR